MGVDETTNVWNAAYFADGSMCWLLNGMKRSTNWRQQLDKDPYPVFTGDYLVYLEGVLYDNETMCKVSLNGMHDFENQTVTRCDNSKIYICHCKVCKKDFKRDERAVELAESETSVHKLEIVEAQLPTSTTEGHYEHWHCTRCGKNFLEGNYPEPVTSEQLIVPTGRNNEIRYTSTDKQKIDTYEANVFGATIQNNEYEYGLGKITFDKGVTSIGEFAFTDCGSLQSLNIPSGVTSIGKEAFRNST